MATVEREFSADHPSALGHFPGNPIIPGAVLLAETLRAIESVINASLSPCAVRSAKFLAPVRPGDRVSIEYSSADGGTVRFACFVGARAVLKGEAACSAGPAAS